MSVDLQEGRLLLERFALVRRMRGGSRSSLWLADDRHLDTSILLQVYARSVHLGDETLNRVRRDVRSSRRLHHPHVAKVHDFHEQEDLLLVSIDFGAGELLSAVTKQTGPLPHRSVVTMLRPLVEALAHVHEHSGPHGQVGLDHVLVDEQRGWILLPADRTRPARGDLPSLGQLLAALLTGGHALDEGRELNDAAERLHQGRTVPALLNQLVNDLQLDDGSARPAGMQEVLHRFDQLERYVEPEPERVIQPAPTAGPEPDRHPVEPPSTERPDRVSAPVDTTAATAPAPRRPAARRRKSRRVAWAAVLGLLVVGAIVVIVAVPKSSPPPDSGEPVVAEITPPPERAEVPDAAAAPAELPEPAPDPAELAKAQRAADEALSRLLEARRAADDIGAAQWAAPAYEEALALADTGDASFLSSQYGDAVQEYQSAAAAFEQLVTGKDQALQQMLADGADALQASAAAAASAAYENALRIDPDNEAAKIGRQRAGTLDELNQLLASGHAHEEADRLDFAHIDYATAVELDSFSEEAAVAFRRIKDKLAEAAFQQIMSRAMEAYHDGDYEQALRTLDEARRMRPDAPEVGPAVALVEAAQLQAVIGGFRTEAMAHETAERWQDAWNGYRQVLAIDAAVQFAQEGKVRCEQVIHLERRVERYLTRTELLTERGTREDAIELVKQLDGLATAGPRMRQRRGQLAELVRLANTPMRVSLYSDDQTEVAVYRVGRFGRFKSKELELLPGEYTVVGQRNGYKDVRLTLRLKPGESQATMQVICTEQI